MSKAGKPLENAAALSQAIEAVIIAIEANPLLIKKTKPDWEGGLNAAALNALAKALGEGPIIETNEVEDDDGKQIERWIIFNAADNLPPVRMQVWERHASTPLVTKETIERIIRYLRGWQEGETRDQGGEWVGPMTKAEMARRYLDKPNARWRDVEFKFPEECIKQFTAKKFNFRIDHLDTREQERCREAPRK